MITRGLVRCMIAGAALLLSTAARAGVYAQDTLVLPTVPDSLEVRTPTPAEDVVVATPAMTDTLTVAPPKKDPIRLNSTKALLWSIIPGGGQIYNHQYWKLPIVIGAYTACYYAINWNNNALIEYSNAYRDIKSDQPMENKRWQDFIPFGADPTQYVGNTSFHEQLRHGRDFYRRYRDLSIIITAGVYLLVMIDAYVDAELSNFDISPNLSMQASPAVITPDPKINSPQSAGLGLHLALTF